MKKCLAEVTVLSLVLLLIASSVSAAEYKIKSGDNLWSLSTKLGHSVKELALMNDIKNVNCINAGNTLIYINEQDVEDARSWCHLRMSQLYQGDPNHRIFLLTANHLGPEDVFYTNDGIGWTHYSSVLCYAQAWRHKG